MIKARVRKQLLPIFLDVGVDQNAMGSQWSDWTDWSNFTVMPAGQEILLMPVVANGVDAVVPSPASDGAPEIIRQETELPNQALPQFYWSPVPDAASYELWIDSRWNAKKVIHRTGLTGSNVTLSEPLELGPDRAWVRAMMAASTCRS